MKREREKKTREVGGGEQRVQETRYYDDNNDECGK